MKRIALLGSTGSIGMSTLDLVRQFPDQFRICGMVAGSNLERLAAQVREFSPRYVAIKNEADVPRLRKMLGRRTPEILGGERGATAVATATEVDVVLAAIVGGAGLVPTLTAVKAGKEVALANKEALVMAGEIMITKDAMQMIPEQAGIKAREMNVSISGITIPAYMIEYRNQAESRPGEASPPGLAQEAH